jgi:hypothetical protein
MDLQTNPDKLKIMKNNLFQRIFFRHFFAFSLGSILATSGSAVAFLRRTQTVTSFQSVASTVETVLQENHKPEEILVVSDWDNVVVKYDNRDHELRESEVSNYFMQILGKNVGLMILTARLLEIPRTDENLVRFQMMSEQMNSALHLEKFFSGKLPLEEKSVFKQTGKHTHETASHSFYIVENGIAFSAQKGAALTSMIDNHELTHQPKVIIFIDDDGDHIRDVLETFRKRNEEVFLLHYPQIVDLPFSLSPKPGKRRKNKNPYYFKSPQP